MKLTQQLRTIPKHWDESPKNLGNEIIINENISFNSAIYLINNFCQNTNHFLYYTVDILKSTYKYPVRMIFVIYCLDPNRKLEGECKVKGYENKIPPYIHCVFTLYNNEKNNEWHLSNKFNVVKL